MNEEFVHTYSILLRVVPIHKQQQKSGRERVQQRCTRPPLVERGGGDVALRSWNGDPSLPLWRPRRLLVHFLCTARAERKRKKGKTEVVPNVRTWKRD